MFEPGEPKKTRTLRNQRVRHPRPNQVTVRGVGAVVSSVRCGYVTTGNAPRKVGDPPIVHLFLPRDRNCSEEVDMHDTKERLSVLWIFALLNYLYADVVALFAIAGSRNSFEPLSPWALMGSAVLIEIPIAMILACRLLPFRANRLANIIAGGVITLVNGFLTFVPPLAGWGRPPAFPEYLFFATIETVATSVIIWQAWTWSGVEAEVSTERSVRQPEAGTTSS